MLLASSSYDASVLLAYLARGLQEDLSSRKRLGKGISVDYRLGCCFAAAEFWTEFEVA